MRGNVKYYAAEECFPKSLTVYPVTCQVVKKTKHIILNQRQRENDRGVRAMGRITYLAPVGVV